MDNKKGFIKDWNGNTIFPITRGELILDQDGNIALNSKHFLAKDNHPGLVTASERALLEGGTVNIQDIYNKVSLINEGLKVNNNPIYFYNTNGKPTPINITTSTDASQLIIKNVGNDINFSLVPVNDDAIEVKSILNQINVDEYGRVTSVKGAPLTSSNIPNLTDKTISNSTLDKCHTSFVDIENSDTAIVNKAYVDSKVQEIANTATGALKFGGAIDNYNYSEKLNITFANQYFKAVKDFEILSNYLYGDASVDGDGKVKAGDTLISYPVNSTQCKFVHVPSGNDITTITVKQNNTSLINKEIGDIALQFSSIFDIKSSGNKSVQITIPDASDGTRGILTTEDYKAFKKASNTTTSYTSSITNTADKRLYKSGTLIIEGKDYPIHGINNIPSLSLINGTSNNSYNPRLQFNDGVDEVTLTYKGLNQLKVQKNDNSIEFSYNPVIISQQVPNTNRTTQYITTTDTGQLGIRLGSVNSQGVVTDGLTDFSQFNDLVTAMGATIIFDKIEESLNGPSSNSEYRYGNTKLLKAVDVTI